MEINIGKYIAKSKHIKNNSSKNSKSKIVYKFYEMISKKLTQITINRANDLWIKSPNFRLICTEILSDCEFKGYYFKLPKIVTGKENLQFILIREDNLDFIDEDRITYNEHFIEQEKKCKKTGIIVFKSIYEDVLLIVPCPRRNRNRNINYDYKNIATFMRTSPIKQIDEFWKTLSKTLKQMLNEKDKKVPLYIYTHGFGVFWFHLRVETHTPKYYHKL